MSTWLYPTPVEMRVIDQLFLPIASAQNPIFELYPFEDTNYDALIWRQKDNFYGLQQIRGLDGEPLSVDPVGAKEYLMQPGYYGEYGFVSESDLTRMGQFTDWNAPVDASELVLDRNDQLRTRELNRIAQICWDLTVNGYFAIAHKNGTVDHKASYTQRTFTSTVAWATAASATPVADLQAVQLMARGYSLSLGSSSTAWLNQQTLTYLLANRNASDLNGMRASFGSTFNNSNDVNALLSGLGLPNVRVYDEGYYNDSNVWTPYIPDNKVVVIGKRTNNARLGAWRFTRNATNPGLGAGPYAIVTDSQGKPPPRNIRVDRGMNGGPVLYFPSAIIVMSV